MGYRLPSNTNYISCNFECHENRNPPSSEPGTDYGTKYGSPLYAVEAGVVTYTRTTNDGLVGRYIEYRLTDGRTTRSLHLAEVWVRPGQRVTRGQQIGKTGASGKGSDWGYGPHVHQTLWAGEAWNSPLLDFAKYVGAPSGGGTPIPPKPNPNPIPPIQDDEEDDMAMKGAYYIRSTDKVKVSLLFNEVSGFWQEHSGGSGAYDNEIARNWGTGSWPTITEAHARVIKSALDRVRVATLSGSVAVDVQE